MNAYLSIRDSRFGKAVFATRFIPTNRTLIEFKGSIVLAKELPHPYHEVPDHYLQIDTDRYLGPSGGLDDFINHSCAPNCGLHFADGRIFLLSIAAIHQGDEITFDYSTTMAEDDWELPCRCGAPTCRGRVRDFRHLPEELKRRYRELRVVAPYLTQ